MTTPLGCVGVWEKEDEDDGGWKWQKSSVNLVKDGEVWVAVLVYTGEI